MNRRFVLLLLAAGIAVLPVACNNGNIYWTLENEETVADFSLPNVTVFDVAKIGTTYYAAAGALWHAAETATEWDVEAKIAPPHTGDLCTALAAFGGELNGGFIDSSGNLGLYRSSTLSFSGQAPVGTALDVLGAQIPLLKVENGSLVAVTARLSGEDFEYKLFRSGDGTTFLPLSITRAAGEELKPINDVIWSTSVVPDAWFATEGTKLYTDGGTGTLALATMTGITAGEVLTGLFDDGTNVYVASKSGAVYYSPDGSSWTRIAAPTVSGDHPPLTHFAGPVGTDNILLVGSEGYGYYRLPTSPAIGALTRFPTTTSPLYTSSVSKFFLDGPLDRIFACTLMGGLWRGVVDVDGTIAWDQM
jgi:hypothetical protein